MEELLLIFTANKATSEPAIAGHRLLLGAASVMAPALNYTSNTRYYYR